MLSQGLDFLTWVMIKERKQKGNHRDHIDLVGSSDFTYKSMINKSYWEVTNIVLVIVAINKK